MKRIRTDVVGSLLRPEFLKQARSAYEAGRIPENELRESENLAVIEAIRLQEAIGVDIVTDGEFRRLNFQDSFGQSVSGFDSGAATMKFFDETTRGAQPLQRWDMFSHQGAIKGPPIVQRQGAIARLSLKNNLPLDEYRFAQSVARAPVKVSLIGPDRISQRFDYASSGSVYSGIDEFLADVIRIEREMISGVVGAGCRYIHIDEPGYTAYVDQPSLRAMRQRGEDPDVNLTRSIQADNSLRRDFDDVAFGVHLCRGNQRSMWHREGAYDAIAERLFGELEYDRFLLEYDSPRAGGFEPLRFVPKGRIVVLGLVSTKIPELETIDDLKRRIDEAARYIPLDQLAVSPQCGFASEFSGNLIDSKAQKRKLETVVELARQVWG